MILFFKRFLFVFKQIVLYFLISMLAGLVIWIAPRGAGTLHSWDFNPSSSYRGTPALVFAAIIFMLSVLSFLILYFQFLASNPKGEMDSKRIFDLQLEAAQRVGQWSKRHYFKIAAAVILLALAIAVADAILG